MYICDGEGTTRSVKVIAEIESLATTSQRKYHPRAQHIQRICSGCLSLVLTTTSSERKTDACSAFASSPATSCSDWRSFSASVGR